MCTADCVRAGGDTFGGASGAVRAAGAGLDYLNSLDLDGAACGELLVALGEIQAKLTAAHAAVLRRFDAADAHDADGYGSSSAWLAAKAGMSKKAARAAVRQMRQLGSRPLLDSALAAGDITDSLAFTIADWTRKLPAGMRTETDRILVEQPRRGARPGAQVDAVGARQVAHFNLGGVAGGVLGDKFQVQDEAGSPQGGDQNSWADPAAGG